MSFCKTLIVSSILTAASIDFAGVFSQVRITKDTGLALVGVKCKEPPQVIGQGGSFQTGGHFDRNRGA